MTRLCLLAVTLALFACGSSSPMSPSDGGTSDGGLAACLERPTDLARAPVAATLTCDLLPPR